MNSVGDQEITPKALTGLTDRDLRVVCGYHNGYHMRYSNGPAASLLTRVR